MDYMPPPPVHMHAEHILLAAQNARAAHFIIYIDKASYDEPNHTATIQMEDAFQKSGRIEAYHGDDITLVYKGETPDLSTCPPVRMPITDIKRDIDFLDNAVTLTISNIPNTLAEEIRRTLCLLIDTDTVKYVSNPNFLSRQKPHPYSRLNR